MGGGMSLLEEVPALKQCAECNANAEWASISLGITLCLECSGAHRSMGVHVSKVERFPTAHSKRNLSMPRPNLHV
jgi:hypothetical protein